MMRLLRRIFGRHVENDQVNIEMLMQANEVFNRPAQAPSDRIAHIDIEAMNKEMQLADKYDEKTQQAVEKYKEGALAEIVNLKSEFRTGANLVRSKADSFVRMVDSERTPHFAYISDDSLLDIELDQQANESLRKRLEQRNGEQNLGRG